MGAIGTSWNYWDRDGPHDKKVFGLIVSEKAK